MLEKGDRLTTPETSALCLSTEQRAVSTFPVLLRHRAPALTLGTSSQGSSHPSPPAHPAHSSGAWAATRPIAPRRLTATVGLLLLMEQHTLRSCSFGASSPEGEKGCCVRAQPRRPLGLPGVSGCAFHPAEGHSSDVLIVACRARQACSCHVI